MRPRLYSTGNACSGAAIRNTSTTIITVRNAPNTTSEGWSAPRYTRAVPSSRRMPAEIHAAIIRGRPFGTSVRQMPQRVEVVATTGTDGCE